MQTSYVQNPAEILKTIGTQHENLFKTVYSIFEKCSQGDITKDYIIRQMELFSSDIHSHCQWEEYLMHQLSYPGLQGHKAQHKRLSFELKRLLVLMKDEHAPDTVWEDCGTFIEGWMKQHVSEVDAAFLSFFRDAIERQDPALKML